MIENPRHRTMDEYVNDAERVREYYRKQGEDRVRSQLVSAPSNWSVTDDWFNAGVLVERTRITALLVDELLRTSGGTFDAKSVLAKLIKAVLNDR